MGRVFRAHDRTLERTVAAKLVLSRTEIDLDTLLRFQQEGAVLARLDHPHIVDVYDTFAEEHATCIIMELLDGCSLGQILRDGPLPLPRAKRLALQVAEALAYAHSQQIVHRDIKPDNVMVLDGDEVKVTDFGIARLLQPDTSLHTIATTGMRMGTPLYMAPEQIEGKKVDGRTDIYALGAMLYHMVTGRPPFEGSDALTIAVKHLQEQPLPPSQVDPAIPPDWDGVILKAMAKDPGQRYQTAAECQQAIAALWTERAHSGGQPRSESLAPAQGSAGAVATLKHAGRNAGAGLRLIAGAAVCLIAAAIGLYALSPRSSAATHGPAGKPIAVWGVKIPTFRHPFSRQSVWSLSTPFHGTMYLSDARSDAILRVSTSGKLLAAWGTKGTQPGEIHGASDITVDSHGNLYVADEFNNRIDKFSPDGTFLASFGRYGFNPGELYRPNSVAVDPHGIMYVADTYNDRIQKLSPTGKPLLVWGSPGPLPGQVHGPGLIKLDAQGNVYVMEHVNKRIQRFSPDGKSLAIMEGPGTGPRQMMNPQGITFDTQGSVYILDNALARVQKFSLAGKLLAVWGKYGSRPGEFNHPWDIAIDAQDHVYVADTGNGRIQILTTSGKPLAEWKITSLLRPLFQRPAYAVVDRHGNTYVSDPGRNAVEKLSPNGDLLLRWGHTGSGPGQFRRPSGVALDVAGNVYVADTSNSRIQEFTSRDRFVAAWPVRLEGTKRRSSPTGLAIDSHDRLYVTDPVNGVVQGYTPAHTLHIQWGWSNPSHPMYRLKDPEGIAVDRQDNVYVADTGNHRVVEFAAADLRGTSLPEGHATAMWGGITGPDRMLRPMSVAVDSRGDIDVTDGQASQIEVLRSDGKLLARWGRQGSDPGQFQGPTGIALDSAGNFYVVDSGNARIQKFPSAG
jgi:DNA-binding beta-propeller fold protein YncE